MGSFFFVIYIYDKNISNVCMAKSDTRGRLANWNSGRLPGELVSTDMNSKKNNSMLFCISAVDWLAGSLIGMCMCVYVYVCVCANGVMNLSHPISLLPSPLFILMHSVLHTVYICENVNQTSELYAAFKALAEESDNLNKKSKYLGI